MTKDNNNNADKDLGDNGIAGAFTGGYNGGDTDPKPNNGQTPKPDGDQDPKPDGADADPKPDDNQDPDAKKSKTTIVQVNGTDVEMPVDWLTDGKFDGQKLVEMNKNLRKSVGKNTGSQAPESYTVDAETHKLGADIGITADNPVVKHLLDTGKDLNLSQDQLDGVLKSYTESMREQMHQNATDADSATLAIVEEYFGGDYEPKLAGLGRAYENILGAEFKETQTDAWETLQDLSATSGGLILLDRLHKAMSGKIPPSQKGVDTSSGVGSKAELDAMIADPRYSKDTVYRAKVTQAFEDFYNK